MAKKLGGLFVFGLAAGVAAAGVYHYLQSRDKELADIDDFNDFDDLDNFDKEEPKRSYVNLDTAKSFVSGTIDKAKVVIDKAGKKVQEVVEDFKKESAPEKDEDTIEIVKESAEETVAETAEETADAAAQAADDIEKVGDTTEEFSFDDSDES
ncbi:MAG: hypothetical protein IJ600_06825 [Lachnospiraceae bacterium]|nr:hypothetical protein [Lachnospiraceae bacterium]